MVPCPGQMVYIKNSDSVMTYLCDFEHYHPDMIKKTPYVKNKIISARHYNDNSSLYELENNYGFVKKENLFYELDDMINSINDSLKYLVIEKPYHTYPLYSLQYFDNSCTINIYNFSVYETFEYHDISGSYKIIDSGIKKYAKIKELKNNISVYRDFDKFNYTDTSGLHLVSDDPDNLINHIQNKSKRDLF